MKKLILICLLFTSCYGARGPQSYKITSIDRHGFPVLSRIDYLPRHWQVGDTVFVGCGTITQK